MLGCIEFQLSPLLIAKSELRALRDRNRRAVRPRKLTNAVGCLCVGFAFACCLLLTSTGLYRFSARLVSVSSGLRLPRLYAYIDCALLASYFTSLLPSAFCELKSMYNVNLVCASFCAATLLSIHYLFTSTTGYYLH